MAGAVTLTPTQKTTKKGMIEKAAAMIKPVSEGSPYLRACIYSRNGIGKTTFAASSGLKTIIIDCNEQGWDAVRSVPNVFRFKLERWDQLDWIFWYLKSGEHDFEVVVIDTVTMLAVVGMKWVLKEDADRDMSRDPMTPDKRHWGKLGELLKDAIIRFRNLDMHVIFLAQEKTSYNEDEETGETAVETHPELSPSPRSTLLSAVALVGRLYAREVEGKKGKTIMERRMLLGPHTRYISKNRFKQLNRIERDPNLKSFLERINGGESA